MDKSQYAADIRFWPILEKKGEGKYGKRPNFLREFLFDPFPFSIFLGRTQSIFQKLVRTISLQMKMNSRAPQR